MDNFTVNIILTYLKNHNKLNGEKVFLFDIYEKYSVSIITLIQNIKVLENENLIDYDKIEKSIAIKSSKDINDFYRRTKLIKNNLRLNKKSTKKLIYLRQDQLKCNNYYDLTIGEFLEKVTK